MSERRRRVLFLIPTLTGGGAERVIVTLLQHLDRDRFDLSLAVVDMRDAAFHDEVPSDVDFTDLHCRRVLHALPRVARLVWRQRPDVVISTLGHLNIALAMLRPLLPSSVRYIARETTVITHGLTEYRRPALWRLAYRRYYRRFDRVICQSEAMRDDLVEHYRVPVRATVVINNPVDLDRIAELASQDLPASATAFMRQSERAQAIRLVAAGRLVEQKGFDVTLKALALLDDGYQLTILGDGPDRARLESLALRHSLAARVHFAGFQKNPYAHFARADAFVLSSRYEGFPNVALEALACGTPVVALPMPGGLREIVQGVPGCALAADMTAEGLAAALRRWQPQRTPPAAVARFSVRAIVDRYAAELGAISRIGDY
jgi:glycosyltransferase involved in cell wall biosynthesis